MNNFILSYNPFAVTPSAGQVLNHVQVSRNVHQYYQPFAGTYIIKSTLSAAALSDSLKGLFENTPYILAQLFPSVAGGTLPQEAWNWLNYGSVPQAPTPSSTINALIDAAVNKP